MQTHTHMHPHMSLFTVLPQSSHGRAWQMSLVSALHGAFLCRITPVQLFVCVQVLVCANRRLRHKGYCWITEKG